MLRVTRLLSFIIPFLSALAFLALPSSIAFAVNAEVLINQSEGGVVTVTANSGSIADCSWYNNNGDYIVVNQGTITLYGPFTNSALCGAISVGEASCSSDPMCLPNGDHTFRAGAQDCEGNSSNEQVVNIDITPAIDLDLSLDADTGALTIDAVVDFKRPMGAECTYGLYGIYVDDQLINANAHYQPELTYSKTLNVNYIDCLTHTVKITANSMGGENEKITTFEVCHGDPEVPPPLLGDLGLGPMPGNDCKAKISSHVSERNRIYYDNVAIPGTELSIHYAGNRDKGFKHKFNFPVSWDENTWDSFFNQENVKPLAIKAELDIGGKVFTQTFPPVANQVAEFIWDGKNVSENPINGSSNVDINVVYEYLIEDTKLEIYRRKSHVVHTYVPEDIIGTGWTINTHHWIDTDDPSILYKGDGSMKEAQGAVSPAIKSMVGGEHIFTEEDGLCHVFDSGGRHQKTVDLYTGNTLYMFSYTPELKLDSFIDRFLNETVIERSSFAPPTAIISPHNIRTELIVDSGNFLVGIKDAEDNEHTFIYGDSGLLTAKIEPNENRYDHVFDDNGRITSAMDEEGGHWQFFPASVNVNGDIEYEVLTGEGNSTSYVDFTDSDGNYSSTITDSTGGLTTFSRASDKLNVEKTLACGIGLDIEYALDVVYGFKYEKTRTAATPGGLKMQTSVEKIYFDSNSDNVPDWIRDKVQFNNKTTYIDNITLQSQITVMTHKGRTTTTHYDPTSLLPRRVQIPDLHDIEYDYYENGKLKSVSQDTRVTTYTYSEDSGFLETIKDAAGKVTTFYPDSIGRIIGVQQPGSPYIGFRYDSNGNRTFVVPIPSVEHEFGYNKVNLNDSYVPPLGNSYSYEYDRDRRLKKIVLPSGKTILYGYENGRVSDIQTPEGNVDFTYLCGAKVDTITMGTEAIGYGYDGPLVTSEAFTGSLNQTLEYVYNNDFLVTDFTYAGDTVGYIYDSDGLLTDAGIFHISRNRDNGLPEAVSGGGLSLDRTFNGYGELKTLDFQAGGTSLYSWDLIRDDLGRVTDKTEVIEGITSNYVYTYDDAGRLQAVEMDGTQVEWYGYGTHGFREAEINSLKTGSGRYIGDKIEYEYSSRGELLRVDLPDGRVVEYANDPIGRRIAKKIDGVVVEKYLWEGRTRLLAVYDGSDTLLMRFEYADGRMPVAMIKSGVFYSLAYDQVGSLRLVVDSSGNVVKRVDYDSFGNVVADSELSFQVPLGFAGGLHDRDTRLVRFGFRDYEPDTGRWTAIDPILFNGGDYDLYGYCVNDPVNWIDPFGLFGLQELADLSAGFGDTLTSGFGLTHLFGVPSLTEWVRSQWNENLLDGQDPVDPCSGYYKAGEWTGNAWGIAFGAAGGARAAGWTVRFSKYQHGGGGMNILRNGTRRFGADWHSFKYKGKMGRKPHYHRGPTKSQMKKHRPWQGGW